MPALPPRADIEQLRRIAKDRLRDARAGDPDALRRIREVGPDLRLATAQLTVARDHGFTSWPALCLEVARRRVFDLRSPAALDAFLREHPEATREPLHNWSDHPKGASPLGYLAMARYDTATRRWRTVSGTAAAAHALIARGAPVNGAPGDPETPLITAASYGDADVAAVLVAAGADIDAVAAAGSGGVPGGSALLHAAVFGATDVIDVLAAAGARVRSLEEAAAVGDVDGWLTPSTDLQTKLRGLVMAADHQRIAVIERLVASGTPVDEADARFGRHPLRLAAANGRPASVAALLAHGAAPAGRDERGMTPFDHCRQGRSHAAQTDGHDEVEAILKQWARR